MKKIFTFLSVVAMAATMSAQTNLVQNPGFENGLTNWSAGVGTGYTLPTVLSDTPHSGANYANYAATATTGFYQNVAIDSDTQYTVSFWYKSSGTGSGTRIWSCFLDSAGNVVYLTATNTTDPLRNNNGYLAKVSDWTQQTITFTSPSNIAQFQLAMRAYNNSNASFDDFSLVTGNLGTVDFSKSKFSLVKNTVVKNEISFAKKSNIQIINMAGQVVKTAAVNDGTTLDVSSLAKGVYIVTGDVNGEKVSQKINKQ